MVRAVPIAMLLGSTALLGCAGDEVAKRTQLMLVADTDIAQLDQIVWDVSEGARERSSGRLAVDLADAPFTMVVLREEGSLGPLTVSATGFRGDTPLVERSALVSFVPGETLTVVLHLVQACMDPDPACEEGMTCTEAGCKAPDAAVLTPWDGTPPRLGDGLDAGVPASDAGPDANDAVDAASTDDATQDADDAIWMQCGSRTVDVNSDIDHCGRCNRTCRSMGNGGANTTPACSDGECDSTCRLLWGDCDGNQNNGCEESLAGDSENCGACGMTCEPQDYCWGGTCRPRPN